MNIVIGEVRETDGTFKMTKAVHLSDLPVDISPEDLAELLADAAVQLIAWRKEEASKIKDLIDSTIH